MRTLLSFLAATLLVAASSPAQTSDSLDPLAPLGLTFGASLDDVLDACHRAGVTILRVDSGAAGGRFRVYLSGVSYRGRPATLFIGGGGVDDTERSIGGLSVVRVKIASADAGEIARVRDELVNGLTEILGPPTGGGSVRPASIASAGFERETYWHLSASLKPRHGMCAVWSTTIQPIDGLFHVEVYHCEVN